MHPGAHGVGMHQDPWSVHTRTVTSAVAVPYRRFAREASDSPCFVEWASRIADDETVLAWIASLPEAKQQPNLVLAAARWHGVAAPGPYEALRTALLDDDGSIRATILSRSTQTNEAGRLATLTPALSRLQAEESGAALSLLEVGASAGLCLYPDRWAYRWSTDRGDVTRGRGLELPCRVTGPAPLPDEPPTVSRRAGLDLDPLDVTDAGAMAWLQNLVWPEQDDRRARLRHAIEVARTDPPLLVAGDLLTDVPRLVAEAAEAGPVVLFHSAVIAYLEPADRVTFDELMQSLVTDGACHWISNEAPGVVPSAHAPDDAPGFVLAVDGETVALTHGHGRTLHWLES